MLSRKLRSIIKKSLDFFHLRLTKNQLYDYQTRQIMSRVLEKTSNCIDVGCHEGEVLDLMLKFSPKGEHFGFEPLPDFYTRLVKKYSSVAKIHNVALSDRSGEATFNYVINNPAYSGFKKRTYKNDSEEVRQITVKKETLDHILPEGLKISFIKIDVEGAELEVLKGARRVITTYKPAIVFEHGKGASDHYGTTPEMIYSLLVEDYGLDLYRMHDFLKNRKPLSKAAFTKEYESGRNYYFFAG